MNLLQEMENLVKSGLAYDGNKLNEEGVRQPHPEGFKIFKYSPSVHYKKLWKTNPLLEKTRGLAFDKEGNIIVHPFNKVYNYGEYDTGSQIPLDTPVTRIEKMNGYLACISKHPYKNELLVSTTGSITDSSDFVILTKQLISSEFNQSLLKFFEKNSMTLMFESIHPDDPHIINYHPEHYGLWLIGARGLQHDSKILSETALDNIAEELSCHRAKWTTTTLGQVLEDVKKDKIEGYMVRLEDGETAFKIKTNYYLITKFLSRMNKKNITYMYNHPEDFKTKIDEEFYSIVDSITSQIPFENFISNSDLNKVDIVRDLVDKLRDQVNSTSQNSKKISP